MLCPGCKRRICGYANSVVVLKVDHVSRRGGRGHDKCAGYLDEVRRDGLAHGRACHRVFWPPVMPGGWAAGPRTLVWGQSGNPDTLDMPISTNGESAEVVTQMFNGLVRAIPG